MPLRYCECSIKKKEKNWRVRNFYPSVASHFSYSKVLHIYILYIYIIYIYFFYILKFPEVHAFTWILVRAEYIIHLYTCTMYIFTFFICKYCIHVIIDPDRRNFLSDRIDPLLASYRSRYDLYFIANDDGARSREAGRTELSNAVITQILIERLK